MTISSKNIFIKAVLAKKKKNAKRKDDDEEDLYVSRKQIAK